MLKKINEHEYVAYNANGREYPVLVYLKDKAEMFRFEFVREQIEKDIMTSEQTSKWCIHQKIQYALVNPYRLKDYFLRPKDVYRFYKTRFQNLYYKYEYEIGRTDGLEM